MKPIHGILSATCVVLALDVGFAAETPKTPSEKAKTQKDQTVTAAPTEPKEQTAVVQKEPTDQAAQKEQSEAQTKLQNQLKKLDREIDELKIQLKTAGKEAQKDMQTQLANLDSDREKVRNNIKKLSQSTGRAWSQIKSGVESAMTELEGAFRRAKEEYSKNQTTSPSKEAKN